MQAHAHLTTKRETFWRMAKLWGFIIINNKELQFRRNFRNSSRKNMRYSVSWPSKRDKLDMLEWPSSTPEVQKMCNYLTIKLPEKHPQIEEKKQLKSCMKAIVTHLIVEQDERLLGLERPFFTMFSRFWRHRSGLTFQCLLFRAYWSLMLSNHLIICLNVGLLNGSSLQHSSINSFNPCA